MVEHFNAQQGVRKIYISMVFLVISEILEILKEILETFIKNFELFGNVIEVVCEILVIIALVWQIAGLVAAKKDEEGYNKAFKMVILNFVIVCAASILIGIIKSLFSIDVSSFGITETIDSLLSLLTDYLIITTTIKMLENNNFSEIAESGRKAWKNILKILIFSIISSVAGAVIYIILNIVNISNIDTVVTVVSIIGVILAAVTNLLELLSYAKFRHFLKNAYPYL